MLQNGTVIKTQWYTKHLPFLLLLEHCTFHCLIRSFHSLHFTDALMIISFSFHPFFIAALFIIFPRSYSGRGFWLWTYLAVSVSDHYPFILFRISGSIQAHTLRPIISCMERDDYELAMNSYQMKDIEWWKTLNGRRLMWSSSEGAVQAATGEPSCKGEKSPLQVYNRKENSVRG